MINVAIVVCTHNRKKYLIECLKSIKKLDIPSDCLVKIVVIDSSDTPLSGIYKEKYIDIYLYNKKNKSLSQKRNIAISKIKADIILFTDDDCIVKRDWLKYILKGFTDKRVMCVTGRTVSHPNCKKKLFERFFSFDNLGTSPKLIKKHFGIRNLWRFGHGNNMAFRRDVFKKVGLFDLTLGVGSSGYAGEDVDMFYRIYKKGYPIFFQPFAIVYHNHTEKKDKELNQWAFKNCYACHILLLKHHDINTLTLYILGLIKLTFEVLYSYIIRDKNRFYIKLYSLLGWIGIKLNILRKK